MKIKRPIDVTIPNPLRKLTLVGPCSAAMSGVCSDGELSRAAILQSDLDGNRQDEKPSIEGIEGIEGKWDMEARGIAFLSIVDSGDKQVPSSTIGGK
jgi:hypothetical protein